MKLRSFCILAAVLVLLPLGFLLYRDARYVYTEDKLLTLAAETFGTAEDAVTCAGKTTDRVGEQIFTDFWYMEKVSSGELHFLMITCEEQKNGNYFYTGTETDFFMPCENIIAEPTATSLVFLVCRPDCKTICLTTENGTEHISVASCPFLFASEHAAASYIFLDGEGKELSQAAPDF